MKNAIIHIVALISGIIIWIFIYVYGSEIVEIRIKLNIEIPENFIVIGKTKYFYIKILVETNRRSKNYINNMYVVTKKLDIKSKLFPKKIPVKILKDEIKLPHFLKIIEIVDERIIVSVDKLKEVILPIQLKGVFYNDKEIKDLNVTVQPDYISLKMPSGIARITKSVDLEPLVLQKLPSKTTTFNLPIPVKYHKYLQEKDFKVKVKITKNPQPKEVIFKVPISVVFHNKTILAKIKTIKIYPKFVTINVQHLNIDTDMIKKNILCYIEIEKIVPSIPKAPINCVIKKRTPNAKVKILELSPTNARVKIYRKSFNNIDR